MTALATAEATPTAQSAPTADRGATSVIARPLSLLGGLALASGPLLIIAGTLTTPPQASTRRADYVASLLVDPFMTNLAASLYHYGWVVLAFGFLAAVGLVRGRRGRTLSLVGGIGSSVGAVQMSGLLFCDWSDASAGRIAGIDQAVAISQATDATLSMTVWLGSAKALALAFPLVLFLGLARAGVLRWWLAPLILVSMLGGALVFVVVGGAAGAVLSIVVSLVGYAPAFVAAARLVRGRPA